MAKSTKAARPATKKSATKVASSRPDDGSEFREFFLDGLKDIYWAEKHLAKALPKLQKASTSEELAMAFEKHTQETILHAEILEQVFVMLGEKPVAKKCEAMAGLLEEADVIIEDTEDGTMIRDAALILAAQKVEHYEIATYGTLAVFARNMGQDEVAELLGQVLENEKATDVALTTVAEGFINKEAAAE